MTLTLTIRNAATLENGAPTQFVLHRRGAIIGRADTCDWSLPDPQRHISSRHCEVSFRDDGYWLRDTSTNGTFVNGSPDPLQAEQQIAQGDLILIGDYEIEAELSGGSTTAAQAEPSAADADGGWQGWTDSAPAAPSGSSDDEWGEPQELPTAAQRW
jgi:type VI secretion system FHA domain protein